MKKCSKCKLLKSLDNFAKDSHYKDGYYCWCRQCRNKYKTVNYIPIIRKKPSKEELYLRKVKRKIYEKKYRENHKQQRNEYLYNRRRKDICFKLLENLRHRLNLAVKNNYKSKKTKKLLGCTIEELKSHLESQFTKGMNWDNYGKWHIDHIRPCASFDLSKPEEQQKCFHYTNLRPLWAIDNMKRPKPRS